MSIFCLLWVPLFFLFRRTFTGGGGGGVWALLLGSLTAILQFLLGYIVKPGGFGFSRWFFGFIEIVSLPVLVPIILYAILYFFRGLSGSADFADFALLWLIPVAALRAIGWAPTNDVILLVSVPMLWTALAVGIPFFINWTANNFRWYSLIISVLCIILLPLTAATSYWAFFSQQTALGFLLFFATQIPLALSFVFERS